MNINLTRIRGKTDW